MKYQKRETELKLNLLDFRIARSLKNNSDAFYSLTVHNISDQILLFSLSDHSYVVWVMWEFCITQVTNS